MTLKELKEIETEQLDLLRSRGRSGDNQASEIVLAHLRAVSRDITDWRRFKEAKEKTVK